MLAPEKAEEALKAFEDKKHVAAEAARLSDVPAALRDAAYAVSNRDAKGEPLNERNHYYDERDARLRAAAAAMDKADAKARKKLFAAFFPHLADSFEQAWKLLQGRPYQSAYGERKAFRAPNNPEVTRWSRIDWLADILGELRGMQADVVTPAWVARWAAHLGGGYRADLYGLLLAGALDAGGKAADEVFQILCDSASGRDEIGAMGRHIVRAFLVASRKDGWEFIEKLLLAAQRQEGLRQSILESVDEAHPEAFRRMLKLICDEKLARFSSLVRAADTWLGYQWDAASVKVVNGTLERIRELLESESARKKALAGKDPVDTYLALWTTAFEDSVAAVKLAADLLKDKKVERRFVGLTLLGQVELPQARPYLIECLEDEDLRVALKALEHLEILGEDESEKKGRQAEAFERIERLLARMPAESKDLKALVWPWTRMRADRSNVARMLVENLGELPPTRLIAHLKGLDYWGRGRTVQLLAEQKKWDADTRDTLLALVGDSHSWVRDRAMEQLKKVKLAASEAEGMEALLSRKAEDLRRGVVGLLLSQSDKDVLASADRLLAGDANKRLAGLELLAQLSVQRRVLEKAKEKALEYARSRKSLSADEQTRIEAIRSGRGLATLDDVLGLLDRSQLTRSTKPKAVKAEFITPAAVALIDALHGFIDKHKDEPLVLPKDEDDDDGPGERQATLLGEDGWRFPSPHWRKGREENARLFPMKELWEEFERTRKPETRDRDGLERIRALHWLSVSDWDWGRWERYAKRSPEAKAVVQAVTSGAVPKELEYERQVERVLEWLEYLNPSPKAIDWQLDAIEAVYSMVPKVELENPPEVKADSDDEDDDYDDDDDDEKVDLKKPIDWRHMAPYQLFVFQDHEVKPEWTDAQVLRFHRLISWRDRPGPGFKRSPVDFDLIYRAFKLGKASMADLIEAMPKDFSSLTSKKTHPAVAENKEIARLVDELRERMLEIELSRGESETSVTSLARSTSSLWGVDTLGRILAAIGSTEFVNQRWGDPTRASMLTDLLKATYPRPEETPEKFRAALTAAVKKYQTRQAELIEELSGKAAPPAIDILTPARLIGISFFAPQWLKHIEAFLGWPALSEGVWWFLAHMPYGADGIEDDDDDDSDYDPNAPEKLSPWERLIRERTPLTEEERREGAVDVAWFQRTYEGLGPKHWETVALAAKYGANANQAKKANYLSEVLLGKASQKDLTTAIEKKHLKESVRLLGLLPLPAGAKRDAELEKRYKTLVSYRNYAKTLGMTRESALRAAEIGMQNLASTAGFPDPMRLEWQMETDSLADLAKGPLSATAQGVKVTLTLDENATPALSAEKAGKPLKSVPPAIKKDKKVAVLVERNAELKKARTRMRDSLETAMCRGDSFTGDELKNLFRHPQLSRMLERLVLLGEGIAGYAAKGGQALRDYAGKLEPIKKKEQLRIAHPYDLYDRDDWSKWQHECFETERVQPFKQVFRELYVMTKQEQKDKSRSGRYSGHQVNPRQAMALLSRRGWTTGEEVERTFFDVNLVASVSFDYGVTTPAEVEGLTIADVTFRERGEWKELPLAKVPPRVFSEVMRDLDLVSSVAHVGGVDPEASASTVEMRASLLRETCTLLGADNVRIKEPHALIKGQLASYSVHLGSGVVHKQPGGSLCIVPVHSQHRGRLFLPFADDDPRTAEVISKVLLLAKDQEIQDPTILEQVRARR